MSIEHTRYRDLPNCLKCSHCRMSGDIPCKILSGPYGFLYTIYCKNDSVVQYVSDSDSVSRTFWYDPNTNEVWVDGGSSVQNDCIEYTPEYPLVKEDVDPTIFFRSLEALVKADNKSLKGLDPKKYSFIVSDKIPMDFFLERPNLLLNMHLEKGNVPLYKPVLKEFSKMETFIDIL